MTRKQRRQYLTLHSVRELVRGLAAQPRLESKTRKSLARLEAKCTAMLDAFTEFTTADHRYFVQCADNLYRAWEKDEETHSYKAFVNIGMTLVADQVAAIPAKAESVRREFQDLEGMLFTLYQHFDPEVEDSQAMNEGEAVAQDFQNLVAA
jgi:hypothetical protein